MLTASWRGSLVPQRLKLDRLRLRGPNGARDEFHLAATAQDLRRRSCPVAVPVARARETGSGGSPWRQWIVANKVDYERLLLAILITDIVDSTKWVAEVGDHDWRALLDRHRDATQYQISRFGGREVGNRGDGFVAIFNSPSRAVRCASEIADTIARLGISLRSGIHAGEVHLAKGEISGIAVHIAARIAAAAHPGEACVSKVVRDLVVGSGLVFEDRGIHELRGLPEAIHLYAIPQLGASVTPVLRSLLVEGSNPPVKRLVQPRDRLLGTAPIYSQRRSAWPAKTLLG